MAKIEIVSQMDLNGDYKWVSGAGGTVGIYTTYFVSKPMCRKNQQNSPTLFNHYRTEEFLKLLKVSFPLYSRP